MTSKLNAQAPTYAHDLVGASLPTRYVIHPNGQITLYVDAPTSAEVFTVSFREQTFSFMDKEYFVSDGAIYPSMPIPPEVEAALASFDAVIPFAAQYRERFKADLLSRTTRNGTNRMATQPVHRPKAVR